MLICTRNRPSLLRRCVEAILRGTVLPETLLVVDQSDDDETRSVVDDIRARANGVQLHRLPSSGGMAVGQNLGFRHTTTRVVAVTDDDCIPSRDWLEQACRAFDTDPELGLLGGRVLPAGATTAGRHAVASRTSPDAATLDGTSMPWDVGSGNNFVVTLDALRAVGGNDERLGPGAPLRGGADMDLFRRTLRAGVRGRYEPALVVEHEPATRAERLGRRVPYGYGMGVACALWWRQGDARAAWILRRWLAMRIRRFVRGLRGQRRLAQEEVLVLIGTVRGLGRGLVVRPSTPRQTERVA